MNSEIRQGYEPVIGLEVHVRLNVNTKIFARDLNQYGQDPNTLISEVSLAYPGTLPKLNRQVIDKAIKIGLACECDISPDITFDRKNYFYPDLPKGYQLTQDRNPVCKNGSVSIKTENGKRSILLTKIHLEEDAGKSIHDQAGSDSYIDFNRAGTALIEIVTEPDLRSPDEAYFFLYEIRRLIQYLEISDGNMQDGSLRCDANVSIRKSGTTALGNKVEIKNMNSLTNVRKAITGEISRQIELKESGHEIVSQTRSFDAARGVSTEMRMKETLEDYRYFPDPDLTKAIISEEWMNTLRDSMPELPLTKEQRFIEDYALPIGDVSILASTRELSDYYERIVRCTKNPKSASNWILGPVLKSLKETQTLIQDYIIEPERIGEIINLIDTDQISFSVASKQLFPHLLESPGLSVEEIARSNHLLSATEDNLGSVISEVLEEFPDEVKLFKSGKEKLFEMLMGQVMRKAKGKADPKKARIELLDTLNK